MKYAARIVPLFVLSFVFLLSGCVVRTYTATKDRVDQDLSASAGNRGYLQGQAPAPSERKATRSTRVVEVELRSPLKFEKVSKSGQAQSAQPATEGESFGNRGYFEQGQQITEGASAVGMQKYTVQKNDTLQKISSKCYGTTKKWTKIYEANKDTLSAPDKIYPGQEINIPAEEMKETKENLK